MSGNNAIFTKEQITVRMLVVKFQLQKEPLMFDQAKQCALICVDEMYDFAIIKGVYEPQDVVDYITKLKQEINNL